MFGLDIDGFLTSQQFLAQVAALIAAIFTAVAGDVIARVFGTA